MFFQDLAIVMIVAAAVMIVFRQLRQPVVLGYILAGLLVGPHTLPFALIGNKETIDTLAELGVIFLMFSLGLEFNLGKLKKVGATALLGASMEIVLMIAAGYQLGRFFGWSQMDSIFLGAILSVSSTTIIVKALDELGKIKERFAGLIFGILIVEDIMSIAMIALLSGLATTGVLAAGEVGMTLLELSAFLAVLLLGGLLLVPRLIAYVAAFQCDEVLLMTVVGLCLGVSLLTAKLGYSVALGAFLIGVIISEARPQMKIERLIRPVRDVFSAVFFVSIGLLIDPGLLAEHWVPVLVICAVVIVGKVVSCGLGTFLAGNDARTSLRVGMGLSQIGEFSFIMAGLGLSLKATSEFLYPITIAVSAITTLSTPYLIRSSDGMVGWFDRVAPPWLLRGMAVYQGWVSILQKEGSGNIAGKILKRIAWQVGLNVLVIAAVFIAARFLYDQAVAARLPFPGGIEALKAAAWFGAMLVNVPLLVATWRKFEAAGMTVAEMAAPLKPGVSPWLRPLIARTLTMPASGLMLVVVFLLSTTLLPSWPVTLLLSGCIAMAAVLSYRASVRLYARAQYTLHYTFAEPKDNENDLPPLLREAHMELVDIRPEGHAALKMISELGLRSTTGASVVAIERGSESLPNPQPEEELRGGDRLLLIGTPRQLQAARILLTTGTV